eukprot:5898190-Prymnesium_polylepis.1
MVNKFGARPVLVVCLAFIALGTGLTGVVTKPWHLFLLWGLVIGPAKGLSFNTYTILTTRFFETHRGLVTGVLTSGSALGMMTFLEPITIITNEFGWRAAAGLCALVP